MSGRFKNRRGFKKKWNGGKQNCHKKEQRPREYRHTEQLQENEVGITEYLSDFEGFTGVLKARFSDFHVNEIDLDGNIAKLTDTSIPKDFDLKSEKFDYKKVVDTPLEILPQEKWDELKDLVEGTEKSIVQLNVDEFSKEDRTAIHTCVKQHFGSKIMATTLSTDGQKIVEFKKSGKDAIDNRFKWPSDKGEYVHFLVFKELIDTMQSTMKLGHFLNVPSQAFTYAGVKDRRAKTTQWFSVKKVQPWKLIVKSKSIHNVKIGNLTFKDAPLKLGDLSGNYFRIALRNVIGEDDLINQSLEFVKANGFINYYGLQRFGNVKEVPTYEIGVRLLQGKFEEATKLILKLKKGDDPDLDISKAKKIYEETGNASTAFEQIDNSRNTCVEAKLLLALSKSNKNDYVTALESIPRNMRLLYIHAFQSLIWNKMVSKRIKEFGLKPIEGDLVLIKEKKVLPEDNNEEDIVCNKEVKVLNKDELDKYTIFDIVMPLPGYDIIYPEHLKAQYQNALEEFGLSLEMEKQRVKTYTLSGDYRNILSQVTDLKWHFLNYDDPNYNLIQSDFEELQGKPKPTSVPNGKFKALVMEFSLNSSSYATMVIREIMKMDTSTNNHVKLNNYFESGDKTSKTLDEEQKKSEVTVEEKTEIDEVIRENSLLENKEKYEQFKNNLFNTICSAKRPTDETESVESKKQRI